MKCRLCRRWAKPEQVSANEFRRVEFQSAWASGQQSPSRAGASMTDTTVHAAVDVLRRRRSGNRRLYAFSPHWARNLPVNGGRPELTMLRSATTIRYARRRPPARGCISCAAGQTMPFFAVAGGRRRIRLMVISFLLSGVSGGACREQTENPAGIISSRHRLFGGMIPDALRALDRELDTTFRGVRRGVVLADAGVFARCCYRYRWRR